MAIRRDFNTPPIFQICIFLALSNTQLPFNASPFPSLKRKGTNFIIILPLENIKGVEGIFEKAEGDKYQMGLYRSAWMDFESCNRVMENSWQK